MVMLLSTIINAHAHRAILLLDEQDSLAWLDEAGLDEFLQLFLELPSSFTFKRMIRRLGGTEPGTSPILWTRSISLDGAVSKAPKFLSSVGLGSPRFIVFALRSP